MGPDYYNSTAGAPMVGPIKASGNTASNLGDAIYRRQSLVQDIRSTQSHLAHLFQQKENTEQVIAKLTEEFNKECEI